MNRAIFLGNDSLVKAFRLRWILSVWHIVHMCTCTYVWNSEDCIRHHSVSSFSFPCESESWASSLSEVYNPVIQRPQGCGYKHLKEYLNSNVGTGIWIPLTL